MKSADDMILKLLTYTAAGKSTIEARTLDVNLEAKLRDWLQDQKLQSKWGDEVLEMLDEMVIVEVVNPRYNHSELC